MSKKWESEYWYKGLKEINRICLTELGFSWIRLIKFDWFGNSSRIANSNGLKRVVQSNKCWTTEVIKLNRIGLSSITESSICSPIIELTGKKWVLFDYGLRKRLIIIFFFRVFQANEREREASEEHRQTRHTRDGGMHLPQSRKSGAPRLLRACPPSQEKGT